jgi:hypothetical protein
VKEPLEYWAVAGKVESPSYRIAIRRPIAIVKFEADLVPPSYTGLKASTVAGGDIEVVEGTEVRFRVELDRTAAEAFLAVKAATEKSPAMEVADRTLSLQLPFREEADYRITARAADGTRLRETAYRIRVRKDQLPRVAFVEPEEALEVHPIAEVLAKVRVDDDFGLTRSGIVFRVNGGEERTLVLKDFKPSTGKGPESASGKVTQAMLEEVLRLEQFPLEQTDSITYYAFAEDNYPEKGHRVETELRFIDIRPFRRLYKVGGT